MLDQGSVYKTISVISVAIPIMYGAVYWMVEASTNAMEKRIAALERQMAKGERFTADDGDKLSVYIERHAKEISEIRLRKAKIREQVAEVRVQQNNVLYRVKRLEDQMYQHEHNRHEWNKNKERDHSQSWLQQRSDETHYNQLFGLCDVVPCERPIYTDDGI